MNKKGAASHVDWAISIGLFVVYVLLLFIFLRPGIQPVYSQSNLVKILETSFNSDGKYTIEKTPIFIRPEGNNFPSSPGEYQLFINKASLPFTNFEEKNFSLQSTNSIPLIFEIKLKGSNQDTFRFNSTFQGNTNPYVFNLLYSTEYRYSNPSLVSDSNPLMYDVSNPSKPVINFTYEFGVKEFVEGFSKDKIATMPEYSLLKQNWKFPVDRDFSVIIADARNNIVIREINNVNLPTNVNVFANTYMDWMLESNLSMYPVRVTIKVW
jgi:hypothetical protein